MDILWQQCQHPASVHIRPETSCHVDAKSKGKSEKMAFQSIFLRLWMLGQPWQYRNTLNSKILSYCTNKQPSYRLVRRVCSNVTNELRQNFIASHIPWHHICCLIIFYRHADYLIYSLISQSLFQICNLITDFCTLINLKLSRFTMNISPSRPQLWPYSPVLIVSIVSMMYNDEV